MKINKKFWLMIGILAMFCLCGLRLALDARAQTPSDSYWTGGKFENPGGASGSSSSMGLGDEQKQYEQASNDLEMQQEMAQAKTEQEDATRRKMMFTRVLPGVLVLICVIYFLFNQNNG